MYLNVVYAQKGDGIFPAKYQPYTKSVVCPENVDRRQFAEEIVDCIFEEFSDFCWGYSYSEEPDCSSLLVEFPEHFNAIENRRIDEEVRWLYERASKGNVREVARHFVPNANPVELRAFVKHCTFGGVFVSMELFIKLLRELHHNSLVLAREGLCGSIS